MADEGFWTRRWNHVVKDWHVIMEAKGVFGSATLLLVAGTALVVWRTTTALDTSEIAGLNATIKADEATIKYQKTQLSHLTPTAVQNAPTPHNADTDFSNLKSLSNEELKHKVFDLTKEMRAFETTYVNAIDENLLAPRINNSNDKQKSGAEWSAMIKKQNDLSAVENYDWQTKYRSRVSLIYRLLCERLGILPITTTDIPPTASMTEHEAQSILQTGSLAGVYPISALADYLDTLASDLR